jgi:toxin-antitoxin system PIN domain toxin
VILPDVSLLVYAHRAELPEHGAAKAWLEELVNGAAPFGSANVILSAFVRIVTHRRAFDPPSTMSQALELANLISERPNSVPVNPGVEHWRIFTDLCRNSDVKGPLVTDAYLAALAIEHNCELATHDGDFKRFAPSLRLIDPLRG